MKSFVFFVAVCALVVHSDSNPTLPLYPQTPCQPRPEGVVEQPSFTKSDSGKFYRSTTK